LAVPSPVMPPCRGRCIRLGRCFITSRGLGSPPQLSFLDGSVVDPNFVPPFGAGEPNNAQVRQSSVSNRDRKSVV
jgi:hypothetical protein